MKKLRLFLFPDCNRACPGCCNNYNDVVNIERETDFTQYDLIMLTGGEPMVKPYLVRQVISDIRKQTDAPIYMYTAKVDDRDVALDILHRLDGMTLTLHTQDDVLPFKYFHQYARHSARLALRLNVFDGIDIDGVNTDGWNVRTGLTWDKDCPLPEGEVLKKYL